MGLKLVLRGNVWHVQGDVRGMRIRKTTGLPKEKVDEADMLRLQWEIEAIKSAAPKALGPDIRVQIGVKRRTVSQACDDFLNRPEGVSYNDRLNIEKIRKGMGGLSVATVSTADVDKFASCLTGAPSSRRRRLTVLKALLNRERRLGHLVAVPHFEMPPENDPRDRVLTVTERDRLLDACPDWFRPLVAFLLYTGARLGEAVRVKPEDFVAGGVVLSSRKGRKGALKKRVVHVSAKLRGYMLAPGYVEEAGAPVFRNQHGTKWSIRQTKAKGQSEWTAKIHKPFKEACDKAGIADFLPHDCRHTFATMMAENGADLDDIAETLGHSDIKMTMRYKARRPSRLAGFVERV